MTPLEELQAAHNRLSELRDFSGTDSWSMRRSRLSAVMVMTDASEEVAYVTNETDADLIVTLHHTIRVQLEIIATARDGLLYSNVRADESDFTRWCDEPNACHQALVLARAINGEGN